MLTCDKIIVDSSKEVYDVQTQINWSVLSTNSV